MFEKSWKRVSSPILLDANVLIAMSAKEHLSHQKARAWLRESASGFATCPITQGALVRFHARLNEASGVQIAKAILRELEAQPQHHFWPDDVPYTDVPDRGLRGYRQVTDAYLAALARARGGRLATLDRALAAWLPDVCVLVE